MRTFLCLVPCVNGSIRLTGGSSQSSGEVEVCINNTWRLICPDDWDNNDSAVICHQLGYLRAGIIICNMTCKNNVTKLVMTVNVPYPHEKGPTIEYRPTDPPFGLNMHPSVAALEKHSSNGWLMRTELRIVYVRSTSNLP